MPPIRIALLICGGLSGTALERNPGDYLDLYTRYFTDTFSAASRPTEPDNEEGGQQPFTLDPYFVARDALVDEESYPDPEAYDALVLTGSASNAYDDIPWINALAAYVARVAHSFPRVRIIGICFGHQIIARALGGACVPNAGRWEIGPTRVKLTDLGKKVFGAQAPQEDELTIQQMHRDHVPDLPPAFHLLGSTAVSPVQGMVRFAPSTPAPTSSLSPSSTSPPSSSTNAPTSTSASAHQDDATPDPDLLRSIQILTVQGHPEFTEPVVSDIVAQRTASGAIDTPTEHEYSAHRRWDADDGRGRIARAVWGVVLGGVSLGAA